MASPRIVPTGVLGGQKGDKGDRGVVGPSGGPFPDLTGVTSGKVPQTTGGGGVEFVDLSASIDAAVQPLAASIIPTVSTGLLAVTGDSITQASMVQVGINFADVTQLAGDSWASIAVLASEGRLTHVVNNGIAGQNSTQVLANLSQLDGRGVTIAVCLVGTNDIGQTVTGGGSVPDATGFATWKANVTAIADWFEGKGIRLALGTIPPNNTTDRQPLIDAWNAWLRPFCAARGIALIDFYTALKSPSGKGYRSGYNADVTHPNDLGAAAMGRTAATTLLPLLAPAPPVLGPDTGMVVNGRFLGTPTSGRAPSWDEYSVPTGATFEVVTDPAVPGKMQRINLAATASDTRLSQDLPESVFDPNDVVILTGYISNSGVPAEVDLIIPTSGGNKVYVPANTRTDTHAGTFALRFTIPSTANGPISFILRAGPGTGRVDFGDLRMHLA